MKVFISHSTQDRWVARKISEELNSLGVATFLDEKDLVTGQSLDHRIMVELESCEHLLVLISPQALKSQWVLYELGAARANKLKVVPILMHVGTNELPSMLSHRLARDINDLDRYLQEIAARAEEPLNSEATLVSFAGCEEAEAGLVVGDSVRVREFSELSEQRRDIPPTYTPDMSPYGGRNAKVVKIESRKTAPGGNVYFLDIDDGTYVWIGMWLSKDHRAD